MAKLTTYSFGDVKAAIAGAGTAFSLGSGAGAAEEGISIEAAEEADAMTVGADGEVMHSLRLNRSGKVIVRLLKTSPVNQLLQTALQLQRASSALWGQNVITIVNVATGDLIVCSSVAFAKQPPLNYAKDGGMIEWEFNAGNIAPGLGAGV
jgi:hypothetical protein